MYMWLFGGICAARASRLACHNNDEHRIQNLGWDGMDRLWVLDFATGFTKQFAFS